MLQEKLKSKGTTLKITLSNQDCIGGYFAVAITAKNYFSDVPGSAQNKGGCQKRLPSF